MGYSVLTVQWSHKERPLSSGGGVRPLLGAPRGAHHTPSTGGEAMSLGLHWGNITLPPLGP